MIFTTSEDKLSQNFKLYKDPIQSHRHQNDGTNISHTSLYKTSISIFSSICFPTLSMKPNRVQREREREKLLPATAIGRSSVTCRTASGESSERFVNGICKCNATDLLSSMNEVVVWRYMIEWNFRLTWNALKKSF